MTEYELKKSLLLRIARHGKLTCSQLSSHSAFTNQQRYDAINCLMSARLVCKKITGKLEAKKKFRKKEQSYFLTEIGEKWVENYKGFQIKNKNTGFKITNNNFSSIRLQ
jgi:predicted transcriptional regulator